MSISNYRHGIHTRFIGLVSWLSKSWYFIVPITAGLLILDTVLQNHLYFSLYEKNKSWSNINNVTAFVLAFAIVVVIIGFIITCIRRYLQLKPFTHRVTDVITLVALTLLLLSALLLGVEKHSINNCIASSQAWNEIGHHKCVEFHVSSVSTSWQNNTFIDEKTNYRQGFSVYIPNGSGVTNGEAHRYMNKTIDVTGTITSYRGAPQILVSESSQIKSK